MPYSEDVKQLAYTLDPACWVSYSGKPRFFKAAMDDRRSASLKKAQKQIDQIKERQGIRSRDCNLPHPDLLAATVSCCGTEISIQCNDHDVRDRLMDFLTGN